MNESENNGQAKGFKGLRSLGPKPGETSERPSAPERRVEAPKLPAAWSQQTDGHQQSSQPQSTTAPSPWRGWAVGLGVLAAIVLFFMWLVNQSPSKRAYPPPSIANQQQPSDANAGPIVTPPPPSNGFCRRIFRGRAKASNWWPPKTIRLSPWPRPAIFAKVAIITTLWLG